MVEHINCNSVEAQKVRFLVLMGQVIGHRGGYPRLAFGFHTLAHMSLHTVHPHVCVFTHAHTHEHIQREVHEPHDSYMVQPTLLGWRPHTGPKAGDSYEFHSSGHDHIPQVSLLSLSKIQGGKWQVNKSHMKDLR